MPYQSTIPAATDALLALLTAETQLGGLLYGIDIIDGQEPPTTQNVAAITVGWSANPLVTSGVEKKSSVADLGGSRQLEEYSIHCASQFIDGDSDYSNARTQAHGAEAVALGIVAANPQLAGAIQGLATPGASSDTNEQSAHGAKVTVEFDVDVKAFTIYKD